MLPPFGSFFIFVLGFFERKKLFYFSGLGDEAVYAAAI